MPAAAPALMLLENPIIWLIGWAGASIPGWFAGRILTAVAAPLVHHALHDEVGAG
jgi:hypothetical protein